jgi:hypothetical protein
MLFYIFKEKFISHQNPSRSTGTLLRKAPEIQLSTHRRQLNGQ